LAVAVVSFSAKKQIFLTTYEHLEIRDEISRQISTSEVSLYLCKDSGDRIRLDVLGSIYSVSTKTNTDEISHIGSNTLSNVITFSIKISETRKPTVVKLERIGPAA